MCVCACALQGFTLTWNRRSKNPTVASAVQTSSPCSTVPSSWLLTSNAQVFVPTTLAVLPSWSPRTPPKQGDMGLLRCHAPRWYASSSSHSPQRCPFSRPPSCSPSPPLGASHCTGHCSFPRPGCSLGPRAAHCCRRTHPRHVSR